MRINKDIVNISTLLSGSVLGQLIPLIILPIISRLYSPEDYGLFAIFTGIIIFVGTISSLRYEYAIVLPKNYKSVRLLVQLSILLNFSSSAILFITVLILHYFFSFSPIYLLLPVANIGYNAFLIFVQYGIKKEIYKKIALSRIIQGATFGLLSIIGGILELDFSLINAFIISYFSACIPLILLEDFKTFKFYGIQNLIKVANKYSNFATYNLPHALLNSLAGQIPVFLFGYLFSTSIAGQYSFSYRILYAPITLISNAISQVYYPKINEMVLNKKFIFGTIKRLSTILIFVAIPILLIFMILSPKLFPFIFGEEWQLAGQFASVLIIWTSIIIVTSPLSFLPLIFTLQKEALFYEICYTIFRILSIIIASIFFKDALNTIMILSIGAAIIQIIYGKWLFNISKSYDQRLNEN